MVSPRSMPMAGESEETVVISFYRYLPLGAARASDVAAEQRRLGDELRLLGRVLVAPEGLNGTVQGSAAAVASYEAAVDASLGVSIDWKYSAASAAPVFPDMAVKEVAELVSFGDRAQAREDRLPLDVQAEGGTHLDPLDFDRMLAATPAEDLRVIDVRNSFEYQVGHFEGAVAQWPRFVEQRLEDLRGKQVLLYCTGGIRCEKASAYLNRRLRETGPPPAAATAAEPVPPEARQQRGGVFQLQGGIHRYLEAFPEGGRFKGANFVFDKRERQEPGAAADVVGTCSECSRPWGKHHGGRVCCVCRALVLVCDACDAASEHGEYYCADHDELRGAYYHFVDRFAPAELERQAGELRARLAAEAGQRRKNRRATLRKKAEQVEARLAELRAAEAAAVAEEAAATTAAPLRPPPLPRRCRACERPYTDCPGACWGFWRDPERQERLLGGKKAGGAGQPPETMAVGGGA